MRKLSTKTAQEIAIKLEAEHNPYKRNATPYYIGNEIHYLYYGKSCTDEELTADYIATAEKDIFNGYRDRLAGYYDKWYRYNRQDDGTAYDKGAIIARDDPKCEGDFVIIPCMCNTH